MKAERSEQGGEPLPAVPASEQGAAGSAPPAAAASPAESAPPAPERTRVRGLYVAERAVPIPAEPKGWKGRLAELSDEFLVALRGTARDLLERYRHQDRYFKLQALVVIAWVLLSGASVWIATGGPPDPAANALRAYVTLEPTSMSWAVMVENRSRKAWRSVEIHLDHGFVHRRPQVAPGERIVLSPRQFSKDGLTRSAQDAPRQLEIRSSEGSFRRSFDTAP